jgi:hypothetical protein
MIDTRKVNNMKMQVLEESPAPLKEGEGIEAVELLRPTPPTELLRLALSNNAAIDVIERLAALQERALDREAERQFNEAMEAAQNEISNVVPDAKNTETGGKYATFLALNRALRPVYLKHGFSLTFTGAESAKPDEVLIVCDCSHKGGWTKKYMLPMPCDGKGAKGGGVMSKSHATLAATSYGRSGLLKMIFNVAIGEDDPVATNGELAEQIEFIQNACDPAELKKFYAAAYTLFEANPAALKVIIAARKARKEERGW